MAITSFVCLLAARQQLIEQLIQHGDNAFILKLTQTASGEHNDIESNEFGLAMSECLSAQPLDAVASYCFSCVLLRDHQTNAGFRKIRWNRQQHGVARTGFEPGVIKNLFELCRGQQSIVLRQPVIHC